MGTSLEIGTHLEVGSRARGEMQSKEGSITIIEDKVATSVLCDGCGTLGDLKISPCR